MFLSTFAVLLLQAANVAQAQGTGTFRNLPYLELWYTNDATQIVDVYTALPLYNLPTVVSTEAIDIKFDKSIGGVTVSPNGYRFWMFDSIEQPFPDTTGLYANLQAACGFNPNIKCLPIKHSDFKLVLLKGPSLPAGSLSLLHGKRYVDITVFRTLTFRFNAMSTVYALISKPISGDFKIYIMQSYTLQTKKAVGYDSLPFLGDELKKLPDGWTFTMFNIGPSQHLILKSVTTATVVIDDFINAYQYLDPALYDAAETGNIADSLYRTTRQLLGLPAVVPTRHLRSV